MDEYVITEHEVGKPFAPPNEDAQIVKCCGHVERIRQHGDLFRVKVTHVLVLWAYPKRA